MKTRLALIQSRAFGSKEEALEEHFLKIRQAAAQGAKLIVLQELFLTPYFCRTQDTAQFDLAEKVPGPTTDALGLLAMELQVTIVASLFEKRAMGLYHNTAAILFPDTRPVGLYRKMHIPQDPGFEEKFYFTPGDLGYRTWPMPGAKSGSERFGVLVCWDQWYPEAARLTALAGAGLLVYPTAIGWLPHEKDTLGVAQHTAWETVQRGHAVANGCYVAAVNRVGREGETEFWGQSIVVNPYGQNVAKGSADREEIVMAEIDFGLVEDFRRIWPFFRDRRIDSYGKLTERAIDWEATAADGTTVERRHGGNRD